MIIQYKTLKKSIITIIDKLQSMIKKLIRIEVRNLNTVFLINSF